jgi:hypothetical protein
MNIDEFERTKPKQTFKAIRDLEKYVQDMLDAKEPWHPNDTIEQIAKKIKLVKETFLKGE